jgi:hypothetical protein
MPKTERSHFRKEPCHNSLSFVSQPATQHSRAGRRGSADPQARDGLVSVSAADGSTSAAGQCGTSRSLLAARPPKSIRTAEGSSGRCMCNPCLKRTSPADPLLMWYGGGLTGVTRKTGPSGGEGRLTYVLRRGSRRGNIGAGRRGGHNTLTPGRASRPFSPPLIHRNASGSAVATILIRQSAG